MSKTNKFIVWCVLIAVTSFWMWAATGQWLAGSLIDQSNLDRFAVFGTLSVVLMSLLSVGFIIFPGKIDGMILSFIVGLMFFIFFGISNINLVGVTVLILLFINADDVVSGDMVERLKLNSRKLIRCSLSNIVLGLFILVSFAAFNSPAIKSFKNMEQLPTSSQIFIRTIVEQSLGGQLEGTSPEQREAVLSQVTGEVMREANVFLKPYFEYIPPALAFGLFLVLWGVGWVFIWLSVFLGMLIYWLLKRFGFFKIEEYDVKAERIII